MHQTKIQEEYINNAPPRTNSTSRDPNGYLSNPFYDRIHTRFTTPNDQAIPGVYTGNGGQFSHGPGGGSHYSKILTPSDTLYFNRPAEWRCSRHLGISCAQAEATSNKVLQQYQYVEQDLIKDIRVAYESEKYPWITAIFRIYISYKRPKGNKSEMAWDPCACSWHAKLFQQFFQHFFQQFFQHFLSPFRSFLGPFCISGFCSAR